MSVKLPFKKHILVFVLMTLTFLIVFGTLGYIAASSSARTKSNVIAAEQQARSVAETTTLLVRLKECADKHKSAKFDAIHTDFAVKFYDNAHSIDEADVKPALIECNRLAYQ